MPIDQSIVDKRRADKIAGFSSQYMSNCKWTKLFTLLSKQRNLVIKCLEKSIYDDTLRELEIPQIELYQTTFDSDGIKDVTLGGPSKFKEIEWIEFPSKWFIKRSNRGEILNPIYSFQDLTKIETIINGIGVFEMEFDLEKLRIYGYK